MASQFPAESPVVKRLRALLVKKKQEQVRLERRLEALKDELLDVKHEHDVRIGRLHHESDMLDYSLFEVRKIRDLVDKGYSYADAKKLVEERTFAEFAKQKAAEEDAAGEELPPEEIKPKRNESAELKRLFRKLAHKFHPDLEGGDAEKMKIINQAYADGNIEKLQSLDRDDDEEAPDYSGIAPDELSSHLDSMERIIVRLKQRLRAFTRSEWYILKTEIVKAKKEEQDFFANWEKRIMGEISKKKKELARLRRGLGAKIESETPEE